MKVLGIDIGIATTGWSIIEKEISSNKSNLIAYGAITTFPDEIFEVRLKSLYEGVQSIIKEYSPTELAIESLFYFKNQKTVMSVSQARGVVLLACVQEKLDCFNYTPLQVKTAVTGYGKAEKKQIQKMVKLIYKLNEVPKPDDVADAIAIATCHLNSIGKNYDRFHKRRSNI